MRADIVGQMSLDEMVREITYFASFLRSFGVEHVEDLKLDFNPLVAGQDVELVSGEGEVVKRIRIQGPSTVEYNITYVSDF